MLFRLVETIRRLGARRSLAAAALLGGVARGAVVFGGGGARAARVVAVSFAMVMAGSGFLVVTSAEAAVAHVLRAGGEVWLVSSLTGSCGLAIVLPLAVVGVRHANRTVRLGGNSLAGLIFGRISPMASRGVKRVD